ncbi:uncharacterized protein N7482_005394 [Penicillium canariense]|uniref:Uncharacterized protein n=1 Tax=Penicillium canariense TaxID=189055 RepID=A0A9W9LNE5_9EURO|nr:uncharacterized protein N7482_005394 [Penicillium canariense]KAJ5166613.1 hypothetical protein N7482_005394 [Penicillium canariense]
MSSVAPSRSLQASALTFVILSIGHTVQGRQWTAEKVFRNIKGSRPWACGTVGWFQASPSSCWGLDPALASNRLSNTVLSRDITAAVLIWSKNPAALQDPLNKALATIANAILWASSAWYAKTGVNDNAVLVGLSAALQAYSVFSN